LVCAQLPCELGSFSTVRDSRELLTLVGVLLNDRVAFLLAPFLAPPPFDSLRDHPVPEDHFASPHEHFITRLETLGTAASVMSPFRRQHDDDVAFAGSDRRCVDLVIGAMGCIRARRRWSAGRVSGSQTRSCRPRPRRPA